MQEIKILPRPDNEHRPQEEWINFFNTEKRQMISMPNIFQLVKEDDTETIESLRKDFDDHWLVTSTRIIYNPDNLSAKIIHNANSNIVKPTEINLKEIPVCDPTYINKLLETNAGLEYIRALLNNKKLTKEEIINFFVKLSGKKEKNIRFWTPSQSSRRSKQVRSVGLFFGGFDRFFVVGVWFGDDVGVSRGVVISSAKQTKFFSNKAVFDTEEETITIPMKKKLLKEIEKKQSDNKKVKINWDLKVQLK